MKGAYPSDTHTHTNKVRTENKISSRKRNVAMWEEWKMETFTLVSLRTSRSIYHPHSHLSERFWDQLVPSSFPCGLKVREM